MAKVRLGSKETGFNGKVKEIESHLRFRMSETQIVF